MSYVSIVGGGNIGAHTACFLAEKGVVDIRLYDPAEGVAAGKTLDMMEASPIRNYRSRIQVMGSLETMQDSGIVVIAVDEPNSAVACRDELLEKNRDALVQYAQAAAAYAAHGTVLVAAEPFDLATALVLRTSGFSREKVIGLGNGISVARFRYLAAQKMGLAPDEVAAAALGRYPDDFIGAAEHACISGVPLSQLLTPGELEDLIEETVQSERSIAEKAQKNGSYYTPAAVAADLVEAIHLDLRRVRSVSVLLQGEYGFSGVVLSVPAIIGGGGVEKVLTPALSDGELTRLRKTATAVQKDMERMKV